MNSLISWRLLNFNSGHESFAKYRSDLQFMTVVTAFSKEVVAKVAKFKVQNRANVRASFVTWTAAAFRRACPALSTSSFDATTPNWKTRESYSVNLLLQDTIICTRLSSGVPFALEPVKHQTSFSENRPASAPSCSEIFDRWPPVFDATDLSSDNILSRPLSLASSIFEVSPTPMLLSERMDPFVPTPSSESPKNINYHWHREWTYCNLHASGSRDS